MYPPHTLGLYLKIFSNILWKNYEWFIKILWINFLPSLITHQHMCESTHIVNKHWPWRVYTHHINTCILKSAPSYTSDSFTDDGTLYLKKESAISHMAYSTIIPIWTKCETGQKFSTQSFSFFFWRGKINWGFHLDANCPVLMDKFIQCIKQSSINGFDIFRL